MIYLDNAATTPVPKAVADAMYDVLTHRFGNPSSQYPAGTEMKKAVEGWRAVVADALRCESSRLYFTSCGTESDNWAILEGAYLQRRVGRHIISSAVEHDAVRKPLEKLAREGWEITLLSPDSTGAISADAVRAALREDTALVTLMMVNNETGAVTDIAGIARTLRAAKSKALLHTDAVQGFMKEPFSAKTLGADMISVSGHKVHAPKGIGALYIGQRVRNPRPLLPGGGQERGVRSGTEATAQIAGFAKAVELRREDYEGKLARMAALKDYCRTHLLTIDGMVCVGEGTAPHILAMSLVGYPSGNIVTDLGAQGICISAGSACHQGKASHVVSALGLDKKIAAGVIRISFSPDNTEADVDALCRALKSHRDSRFPML